MMPSLYNLAAPPDAFGCRKWLGKKDRDGYGVHERTKAHIAAWNEARGPVPADRVLDHVCRVRSCIRISHLEPVTEVENQRRKRWGYRVRRERCPAGHDMQVNSVIVGADGGRVCRRCNEEGA